MRRVTVFLAIVFMCLARLAPVEALSVTGLSVTLDCAGGHYSDYENTFDRDNTGTGEEHYQVIVTDADDNVIHLVDDTAALGGPFPGSASDFTYNLGVAVPGAITYQWISLAGNSLEEQVAYSTTGFCGESPTATPTATPTEMATPGPTETATPTITPTANVIDLIDVGGQPVLVVREVRPADVAIIGLLVIVAGLLLAQMVINAGKDR